MNFLIYVNKNKVINSVELVGYQGSSSKFVTIKPIDEDFFVMSVFIHNKRSLVACTNENNDYSNFIQQAYVNNDDKEQISFKDLNPAFTPLFFDFISYFGSDTDTQQALFDLLLSNINFHPPKHSFFTRLDTHFINAAIPYIVIEYLEDGNGYYHKLTLWFASNIRRVHEIREVNLNEPFYIYGLKFTIHQIDLKNSSIWYPSILCFYDQHTAFNVNQTGDSVKSTSLFMEVSFSN